jgi:hypothetical protein
MGTYFTQKKAGIITICLIILLFFIALSVDQVLAYEDITTNFSQETPSYHLPQKNLELSHIQEQYISLIDCLNLCLFLEMYDTPLT